MNMKEGNLKELHFISRGGEMGEHIRSLDWSKTFVGSIHTWPQSLRTTLSILINSKFPMFLFWGPELVCFYNDAYRPSLGNEGKHPFALGMPGEQVWPEIWPIIKPLIDQVLSGAEATWHEDQLIPIFRNGKMEDVYWTFSYSPVYDESGNIGGVMVVCKETTKRVVQLNQQKDYLQSAIDIADLGTFNIEVATNTAVFSEKVKNWFGLDSTSESMEVISERVHPQDRQFVLRSLAQSLESEEQSHHDFGYRLLSSTDASIRHLRSIGKLHFQDSVPCSIIGIIQDVTPQITVLEKLKESEQRFRTMADASPSMIWALNPDSSLKYANKFMLKFLGISLQEFIDENWLHYIHPQDVEQTLQTIRETIAKRKLYRIEQRLIRHDGQYRWIFTQGAPSYYPNGELYGYVGSSIDITELKEAQQVLQGYAQELASANEELSAANEDISSSRNKLEESYSYLSRVNLDLDNFIYTASHDLKAPINNIEGLMHMLKGKMGKKGWEDQSISSIIDMIDASVLRFKRTVTDLADISKADKQMNDPCEAVDIAGLISGILLDLQIPIEQSNARIELEVEACPQIVFSKINLRSILYNLISNAIKYRDSVRTPHITISCRQEETYRVLSVADNGLGLKTSDENKIFGMFKRQHTHVEGTGVGLYIVKKIIENAGGKITVESKIGEGSLFQVYIKG
jgi:PAS domain S-box-containing protein